MPLRVVKKVGPGLGLALLALAGVGLLSHRALLRSVEDARWVCRATTRPVRETARSISSTSR